MRTAITPHELLPEGLRLEGLSIETERVSIRVASGTSSSRCPVCGCGSSRAHSRYWRAISDLPWHGISVTLLVRTRRFFCDGASCERRIFCERLPKIAARARKTGRLVEEALLAIVLELGGRAGARLAAELGLVVGRDSLLRRAKNAPLPAPGRVRVLGIDDFAFRKGDAYGTILVDLERHKVVDLLPKRSTRTTADWLLRHPGVEAVSRDRSNIYAQGISEGAPKAVQVADRWHLLRSLALGLEEFLLHKRSALGKAAAPETNDKERLPGFIDDDGVSPLSVRLGRPYGSVEGPAHKRHERLVEQWKHIRRLHLAGARVKDIAEWVGTSQSTVYRYRELAEPPPQPRYRRRASVLDPYLYPTSSSDGTRAAAAPSGSTPRSETEATATASTR